MNEIQCNSPAGRLATVDELLKTTVPAFLSPPPSRDTLRTWLDKAKIPRFKSNPTAKRGGGPVFYSVSATEKFFRNCTMKPVKFNIAA